MSCERFRPALAAHAAGAAFEPAAERHLGECAACRQLLDTQARLLAELDAELGRTLSIELSPGFAANVARSALEAGSAPERRWIPGTLWASLAAAAVIVLAVWISGFRPKPEATQTTSEGIQRTPGAAQTSTAGVRMKPDAARAASENLRLHPGGRGTASPNARLKPKRVLTGQSLRHDCVASGFSRKAATQACASPATRLPSPEPPVIVEPERALAIQRLRELMTEGRLDETMLPPPVTPEAALAELSIAPLAVAEIRVPDVEIVGRPPAAPERQ
jgi:hypothetical protein